MTKHIRKAPSIEEIRKLQAANPDPPNRLPLDRQGIRKVEAPADPFVAGILADVESRGFELQDEVEAPRDVPGPGLLSRINESLEGAQTKYSKQLQAFGSSLLKSTW